MDFSDEVEELYNQVLKDIPSFKEKIDAQKKAEEERRNIKKLYNKKYKREHKMKTQKMKWTK